MMINCGTIYYSVSLYNVITSFVETVPPIFVQSMGEYIFTRYHIVLVVVVVFAL